MKTWKMILGLLTLGAWSGCWGTLKWLIWTPQEGEDDWRHVRRAWGFQRPPLRIEWDRVRQATWLGLGANESKAHALLNFGVEAFRLNAQRGYKMAGFALTIHQIVIIILIGALLL